MSQNFTKEDFLKILNQGDLSDSRMDDLDRKAAEGFQYLESEETAQSVLDRIDARFDAHLNSVSTGSKVETKVFSFKRIQRLAAVLLLFLIPAYFIFKAPTTDKLFVANFEAPRSTYFQQTRGSVDKGVDVALKSAFQSYEMGDYDKAKVAIAELSKTHADKPDLLFYQGLAALGAGDAREAIDLFTDCLDIEYQNVQTKAPWYLALSYLKLGDKSQAIKWLEKSIQVDDRHRNSAETLLEDLN